jgi:hypothetical protein
MAGLEAQADFIVFPAMQAADPDSRLIPVQAAASAGKSKPASFHKFSSVESRDKRLDERERRRGFDRRSKIGRCCVRFCRHRAAGESVRKGILERAGSGRDSCKKVCEKGFSDERSSGTRGGAVFWREGVKNGFFCVENGFFALPALGVKRRGDHRAEECKWLLGGGLGGLVAL